MTYLLTERQKIEALIARGQNLSYRAAAEQTGVLKSHIQYLEHKFENNGTVKNLFTGRRTMLVTNEETQNIVGAINANRFLTSIDIANNPELNPHGYSYSTINRVINNEGHWYSDRVDNLIWKLHDSMPLRIRELIRQKGKHT